ncbi:MAG: GPP34 family phosphoprotein [Actinobacteria bacterium]|nr:GPP34 family phosphoprotein [Actinomycetota bacterium]
MFTMPEELILLALDDEKGTAGSSATTKERITYGLTTAIIMELLLAARIKVKRPPHKFLVIRFPHGKITVADPTLTGDEIADDALKRIQQHEKVKGPFYWIDKLGPVTVAEHSGLIDWSSKGSRFLSRLATQGVILKMEHKTMGLISSPRFKLMDPTVRQQLRERIDQSLFQQAQADRRQVMLISLLRACQVLDCLYPDRNRRHRARDRASELQRSDDQTDFLIGELHKVRAAHDPVTVT